MRIKTGDTRGHFDHGWLKSWHTFSFGHYQDPDWMGYRTLRVMNEDIVQPGQGFPTHPHRNMEIVTYIIEGSLEHQDSTGGGSVISKGDCQHMTAGSGIRHSEFNPSRAEPVHLYQIWIEPAEEGLAPGYTDRKATTSTEPIELLASPDGEGGSLRIHQDASISLVRASASLTVGSGRHLWLQIVRGDVHVNGERVGPGDAIMAGAGETIEIEGPSVEALAFDLG